MFGWLKGDRSEGVILNSYAKMIIIGAIGLTIIAIILGVTTVHIAPAGPTLTLPTGVPYGTIFFIMYLTSSEPEKSTWFLLWILWMFGFFSTGEE